MRRALPWVLVVLIAAAAGLLGARYLTSSSSAPLPDGSFDHRYEGSLEFPGGELTGPRILIPSIDLEVPLVESGEIDGALAIPPAPNAGWYTGSARPGAGTGASVIAGHVDTVSGELTDFGQLHTIKNGAPIFVVDEHDMVHTYVASAMEVHDQDQLPTSTFNPAGDPLLHVLTCGGDAIEGGSQWRYEKNVLLTTTLHSSSPLPEQS